MVLRLGLLEASDAGFSGMTHFLSLVAHLCLVGPLLMVLRGCGH